MNLFLVSLAVILMMIGLMAIGVWLGKREPLKGTCGGLNRFTGDKECPVCGGDTAKCESSEAPEEPDTAGPDSAKVGQWRP
jgi:hypothetical protein